MSDGWANTQYIPMATDDNPKKRTAIEMEKEVDTTMENTTPKDSLEDFQVRDIMQGISSIQRLFKIR